MNRTPRKAGQTGKREVAKTKPVDLSPVMLFRRHGDDAGAWTLSLSLSLSLSEIGALAYFPENVYVD